MMLFCFITTFLRTRKKKIILIDRFIDSTIAYQHYGFGVSINLIKSSGNIRFDNSALQAVKRVETFSFFKELNKDIYDDIFKNISISFNPSK